jgi:hypothetical protein
MNCLDSFAATLCCPQFSQSLAPLPIPSRPPHFALVRRPLHLSLTLATVCRKLWSWDLEQLR